MVQELLAISYESTTKYLSQNLLEGIQRPGKLEQPNRFGSCSKYPLSLLHCLAGKFDRGGFFGEPKNG